MRIEERLKTVRNGNEGFTLVELMVVVAIVGILVAIAIPQYSKFQAKARQTEAKTTLGAIYTAEQSFSVENGSFTECLSQIGASVTGNAFYYTTGFLGNDLKLCSSANNLSCIAYQWNLSTGALVACAAANATASLSNSVAQTGTLLPTQAKLPAGSDVLTNSTFLAAAVGDVSQTAGATWDTWTMDNTKVLTNTVNSL